MEPMKLEGLMQEGVEKRGLKEQGNRTHIDKKLQSFLRFQQELRAEKGTGRGRVSGVSQPKLRINENAL